MPNVGPGNGVLDELLALSDVEQETLLKRLTLHAYCKMRHLTWRGVYFSRGAVVPAGYEPYDFALDAIEKLLDGRRPWNREKYLTLETALRATIDSDWQERFHKAAMKELKGDDFLVEVFELLAAEFTKPEEIATMLDTTVDEVNNAKKRLRRKLEKLDGKYPPPKRRAKV